MEEFFDMVGFTPPGDGSKDAHAGAAQGSSSGTEQAGGTSADSSTKSDSARSSKKYSKKHSKKSSAGSFWDHIRDAEGVSNGGGATGGSQMSDAVAALMPNISKGQVIGAVILLLAIIAAAYWWFHPPINIHSEDLWVFVAVVILLPSFIVFRVLSRKASVSPSAVVAGKNATRARMWHRLSYIPVAVLAIGIIGAVLSLSFIPGNAEKYSNILNVETTDFASDIQEVDYNSIPVIDGESSQILGNRTLGEIPEYVSQFEISPLYSQINYQGRPVRVSPLNYADLFKWFNNRNDGIPAYVLVDMASQDTQVVRPSTPIYYSESEPLERNIDRYVQLKYPFYLFEQKSFEIDEDGTPWWVCPVQTRTIGLFGGETITRVVLVNASTGETQDMAIEDVPQWVDRAYPSDLLLKQYNWHGALRNGWLNSWLGQRDVVQTTPGTDGRLGYNYIAKDDDVWVYTGVTSATADNAIVGFVLVNQRTAEARYYPVAGATEESAMNSAQGQVQHLGYTATFPLLLNINGQPTYFMALKDKAGLAKMFAMLDIQRYQNVAIGDTVQEAQKSYKALLATNGVATGEGAQTSSEQTTGTIRTMTQAVIDSNTHVYLTLEGNQTIFDAPLPGMLSVVAFAPGDQVQLEFVSGDPTATVTGIESVDGSSAATDGSAQRGDADTDDAQKTGDSTQAPAEKSGDTAAADASKSAGAKAA